MPSPLSNPVYRNLLSAQILSLLGTGLSTVALGLLAYELAGADAGVILGTALFLKMIAYVGISPLAGAVVERLPRKGTLIALDLVRAGIALSLPFVTSVWQVYGLILLLQAASAAFTPAFQATIPDVLEDEPTYTRALSLSRLAYDLESLVSPMLAAALLLVLPFHWLFAGTSVGFVLSAGLVFLSAVPARAAEAGEMPFGVRVTRGVRLYLSQRSLRGLLALNMAVSAAGAMVIVNSVVLVRSTLGRAEADLAWAFAAYGAGAMAVALALPRILDHRPERGPMLAGGAVLAAGTATLAAVLWAGGLTWEVLLGLWLCLGAANSAVMTPSARLLRRAADPEARPSIFTAQFALSHGCWLITYPLAGYLGGVFGLGLAATVLALIAGGATVLAIRIWRPAQIA